MASETTEQRNVRVPPDVGLLALEEVWRIQEEFQQKLFDLDSLTEDEVHQLTFKFLAYMQGEGTELLQNINWKMHREDKLNVSRQGVLGEWVDIFKYWLSIGLFWKFTPEEFLKEFKRKSKVVDQRWYQERILTLKGTRVCVVDIDQVLCNYIDGFLEFLGEELGLVIPPDVAWKEYDLYNNLAPFVGGPSRVRDLKFAFRESGWKTRVKPIPGARELLAWLKESGRSIVLMTARPVDEHPRITADTVEWLEENDMQYDALRFASDKRSVVLTDYHQAEFIIDDHPGTATMMARARYEVFMPAYPYNDHIQSDYVHRVDSLDDIRRLLEQKGGNA